MKFEYTLAELSTAITALEQVYGKVSVLDPYLGTVLDPATLQPTDKAEELTALDETGRGVQLAQAGKPVGVVMARVNEYWSLRQNESANAADCCLNMAAGILQLSVGTDDKAAVLARLEDGLFAVVTVGTPAAQVARKLQDALDNSRREFSISLSRRGSFTVQLASAEWGETPAWDMMFSLAQQRL